MSRYTKIAVPGLVRYALPTLAVLAVAGGVAFAAQSGKDSSGAGAGSGQTGDVTRGPRAFPHPPGPPFAEGDLAYGELHVVRDGEEVVIRIDRGKVTSASSEEITVSEANGDEVTIPVDEDTKVFAGPFRRATLDDVDEGETVIAHRTGDGAADHIAVLPKNFPRQARGLRFRHPAPPPGVRRGRLPAPPGFAIPAPPPNGNGSDGNG